MVELTPEQQWQRIKQTDKIFLTLALIFLLMCWFGFVAFLIITLDMGVYEGLGLGTVTGIFLTAFANTWQFWFRKQGS